MDTLNAKEGREHSILPDPAIAVEACRTFTMLYNAKFGYCGSINAAEKRSRRTPNG